MLTEKPVFVAIKDNCILESLHETGLIHWTNQDTRTGYNV